MFGYIKNKFKLYLLQIAVLCMITIFLIYTVNFNKSIIHVNVEPKFTVEMALNALVRATKSADKVCYDSEQNEYYLHYSEELHADETEEKIYYHGWQTAGTVQMYPSSNGTWYIQNWSNAKLEEIAPDVTGLPCKNMSP